MHIGQQQAAAVLTRRRAMGLLLAIVAFGSALRLWGIDRRSLWVDEGQTAYAASLPVGELGQFLLADGDTCGPLFYAVTHYAVALAPYQVWMLRLPAAIFGILAVLLAYPLAGELFRTRWAGLAAALALAANPIHIHHSGEARNYTLYFLLTMAASYCLVRLARRVVPSAECQVPNAKKEMQNAKCKMQNDKCEPLITRFELNSLLFRKLGRLALWTGFVLAGAGMIYTHNVAFIFLAALFVFYPLACWFNGGFFTPGRPRTFRQVIRPAWQMALAGLAIGLLYLPWMAILTGQLRGVLADCWIPRPTWAGAIADLKMLVWYPWSAPAELAPSPVMQRVLDGGGDLLGWVTWCVCGLGWLAWAIRSQDRRGLLLALALAGATAAVIGFSVLGRRSIWEVKVVLPLALVPALGLAALPAGLRGLRLDKLAWSLVAGILALACGLAVLVSGVNVDGQWKESVAWTLDHIQPGEPLLVDNTFDLRTVEWYVHGSAYGPVRWQGSTSTVLLPGGSVANSGGFPDRVEQVVATLRKAARPGRRVWVISRSGIPLDPVIRSCLESLGPQVESREFVGVDVRVVLVMRN